MNRYTDRRPHDCYVRATPKMRSWSGVSSAMLKMKRSSGHRGDISYFAAFMWSSTIYDGIFSLLRAMRCHIFSVQDNEKK